MHGPRLRNALSVAIRNSRGYLKVLVVVSGARLFGLGCQFVVLILLSRLLSKDHFGDLMTAFGFYRLAGMALGVGPSLLLLFHISRRPHDQAAEVRLHRYSTILGALSSSVVALVGVFAAGPIEQALDKPGLGIWLQLLAPFAVFSTLLIVASGALEGRSRISESIMLNELVPNVIRIALLPAVALSGLPDTAIAHVLTLSVLLPWLWAARRLWNRSIGGTSTWTRWDYGYAGKYVVATLFANQLCGVDILVAGTLFPSETVADYAVASRIAALYSFFQIALLKKFAPLAGHLQEIGDLAALRREVELCSRLVVGCTIFTICGIIVTAPYLLRLFGNYHNAEALLIWLAIPTFVQAYYATADRLLISAGVANIAVLMNGLSFLILTTAPFVVAPWLGILSIPAAMIVSTILLQPIVLARTRQMFAIRTIGIPEIAMMVCGSLAIAADALLDTPISAATAFTVLGAFGLAQVIPTMRHAPAGAAATL